MGKYKVSYIKKQFAKGSIYSTILECSALALLAASLTVSVRLEGEGGINVAAMGFCSLLLAAVGIWYGIRALFEKEKNYILAKLSLGVGGVLVLGWLVLIIIGFGG